MTTYHLSIYSPSYYTGEDGNVYIEGEWYDYYGNEKSIEALHKLLTNQCPEIEIKVVKEQAHTEIEAEKGMPDVNR